MADFWTFFILFNLGITLPLAIVWRCFSLRKQFYKQLTDEQVNLIARSNVDLFGGNAAERALYRLWLSRR